MYTAYFQSYFYDAESKEVAITKEEFDVLKKVEHDLRIGNCPDELVSLVWDDIRNRKVVRSNSKPTETIEIAVC